MKANTTGGERTKVSALFTAAADGTKFKIFVIVPRATDLPNYTPPDNVIVVYKTGATFNEDTICQYLEEIIDPVIKERKISKPIIILDSARCHLTKKVDDKFSLLDFIKHLIPARMTNLLQPAESHS